MLPIAASIGQNEGFCSITFSLLKRFIDTISIIIIISLPNRKNKKENKKSTYLWRIFLFVLVFLAELALNLCLDELADGVVASLLISFVIGVVGRSTYKYKIKITICLHQNF